MGPGDAVRSVLRNFARFDGRASRSEYWWFWLVYAVGLWVGLIIAAGLSRDGGSALGLLVLLAWLVLIIPSLAVFVRRLHDSGRSGWWWLLALIPFGGLVVLIFLLSDSEPGMNRWGAPPPGSRYVDPSSWRYYQAGPQAGWGQPGSPQPGYSPPQQPTWPTQPSAPPPPPGPQPAVPWQATPVQPGPGQAPTAWSPIPGQAQAPEAWQPTTSQPQPPAPPTWPGTGGRPPGQAG